MGWWRKECIEYLKNAQRMSSRKFYILSSMQEVVKSFDVELVFTSYMLIWISSEFWKSEKLKRIFFRVSFFKVFIKFSRYDEIEIRLVYLGGEMFYGGVLKKVIIFYSDTLCFDLWSDFILMNKLLRLFEN